MQHVEEEAIEALIRKAAELKKQGKSWHFHMLTPNCAFNKHSDKHAFVLESETKPRPTVVYSAKRHLRYGNALLHILYGKKFLEEKQQLKGRKKPLEKSARLILEKERKLNEKGILWHHHLLFPHCIFNTHASKWRVFFEDEGENMPLEFVSAAEPKEFLRQVEALFYAQKE